VKTLLAVILSVVSLPVLAYSGGVTTVSQPGGAGSTVVQTNVSRAKTPELDQTYQRTIRRAQSAAAAATAVRGVLRLVPVVSNVIALAELASALNGTWSKDAAGPFLSVQTGSCTPVPASALSAFSDVSSGQFCARVQAGNYQSQRIILAPGSTPTNGTCRLMAMCAYEISAVSWPQVGQETSRLSDADLETAIAASPKLPAIISDLQKQGIPILFPEPDLEDLPKPIVLPPTVTKNPDGSTRTEQTTLIPTQDAPGGPVIWKREVVTSTTSAPGPDGSTTTTPLGTTTSSTGLPPKADDAAPAVVPALPDLPELYKRAYPDGMVGVWSDHKDALSGSAFLGLLPKLFPAIAADGSCPSMVLDFNISRWALFGVRDVAPPCWVWDFGKAVIIFSALLLARSLVFGG
jgi:hypothetical protein